MLAGWLPDREEGLSASQQLEVTSKLPSQVVVVALKPPVAGIMAKIQTHSTAKQINQIQDKPYVITQKQVQQQHFQKLKVRRQRTRQGKSPSESEPFCSSDHCIGFEAFFFLPFTSRVVKGSAG